MEDSRGALCRNRRLFGTLERLRCGWARQDREGGEGRERAGSSCLFLQGTWLSSESDWVGGGAVITMAACRADASGILKRSGGDAACEGGIVGDDRENRPQGGVWACPDAADGMVPGGGPPIDWIAGDPSAAGRAQAASRKVGGCGIEHSGHPARFRPEGWPGDPQNV